MRSSCLFPVSWKRNGTINIKPPLMGHSRMSTEVGGPLTSEIQKALASLTGLGAMSSPYLTTGRSGVKHSFTFGSKELNETKVVCDVIVGSAPVDETKVLSLFIKVYDIGAKHAILCAVPSLTEEAKKLSAMYKITTVQSSDPEHIPNLLTDVLRKLKSPS